MNVKSASRKVSKIFLSHSSGDKALVVEKLAKMFRDNGTEVFYDEWSIKPADRLRDKISDAISECDFFVIVLSKRAIASNWVKHELDQAMILEIEGRGPKVIPIIYGRVDISEIPLDLRGFRWIKIPGNSGRSFEKGCDLLLSTMGVRQLDYEIPLDQLRVTQASFVQQHLNKCLNYEVYWKYWSKPVSLANWHKLLYLIKEDITKGRIEAALVNVEVLDGTLQYYAICPTSPPRMLDELISSPIASKNGRLLGRLFMLANTFKVLLPTALILKLLKSKVPEVLFAICTYIEETGVSVDEEISRELLLLVESKDDQRFYFSGSDSEGNPMVVDSREKAAVCLMLAESNSDVILSRVSAVFPRIASEIGAIRLRAMVLSGFGGSHRKSIPDPFVGLGKKDGSKWEKT